MRITCMRRILLLGIALGLAFAIMVGCGDSPPIKITDREKGIIQDRFAKDSQVIKERSKGRVGFGGKPEDVK
jgi:hypothetical protein